MSLFCMFPLQIISFLGKNLQSSADSHISKVKLYKQTNKNERDRMWRKWPCVSQSAWKEIIDSFLFPSTKQYKYTTKEAKKTRRMKNKKMTWLWAWYRLSVAADDLFDGRRRETILIYVSFLLEIYIFSTPQLRARKKLNTKFINFRVFVCWWIFKGGHYNDATMAMSKWYMMNKNHIIMLSSFEFVVCLFEISVRTDMDDTKALKNQKIYFTIDLNRCL